MYRVLLVDDEPLIRKGLMATVDWELLGLEVVGEASNGREALECLEAVKPHLIITDIRMPIMNGIEFIEHIRENNDPVKIIILSGFSDYVYLKKAIEYNVDNYLLKPIDQGELLEILGSVVTGLETDYLNQLYQSKGKQALKITTMNRLVSGNITMKEFKEKRNTCDIHLTDEPCRLLICHENHGAPSTYWSHDIALKRFSIMNVCQDTVGEMVCEVFIDAEGRTVILSNDTHGLPPLKAVIKANLKAYLSIDAHVRVSDICYLEDISGVYGDILQTKAVADKEEGDEGNRGSSIAERVMAYGKAHYFEQLSLKQMAQLYDVNASYLGQLIKKAYGSSFTELINRYRIEEAVKYLKSSTMRVYEISEEVGYTNYQYFIKIFKKYTGKVPSDYR